MAGRPRKNNLLYFTHDCDAFESPKFVALRARFGWPAEGRFWALNGMIGRADGCRLDLSKPFIRCSIAEKLGMTMSDFDEFVAFLADPKLCDLLQNDDGILWTDRTKEELEELTKARDADYRRKQAGKSNFPGGILPDNGIVRPDSDRKKQLSGEGATGATGIYGSSSSSDATPPAAAALSVTALKKRLADAGILLAPAELEAIAAELIAKSVDCDAFLAWALAKAAKARMPSSWFVKGVLEWDWIGKWRENGSASKPAEPAPYVPIELHTPSAEDDAEVERLAAETRARLHMVDPPAEIVEEPAVKNELDDIIF
jgi:hypothetical protein